jgi:hypothetical protein
MTYPGGKGGAGVAQLIINQQPPHSHYIEPFLGSGAVMLLKRPAFWNTGIDLDPEPIAKMIEPSGFTFLCEDGVQWLAEAKLRPDALVYCDPPYLMKTRRSQRALYHCEFDEDDHWRLLRVLRGLKCMVQISGYWSSLYAKRLEGWRLVRYQAATRGGPREECLWMNYPEPAALHDYRFLGGDFRQRERIKRKAARWFDRITSLPALERQALVSMIARLAGPDEDGRPRAGIAGTDERAWRDPATLELTMTPARRRQSLSPAMIDRPSPETEMLQ